MSIWRRTIDELLGRGKEVKRSVSPDLAKTAPLQARGDSQTPRRKGRRYPLVGSAQSLGRDREENEDTLLVFLEIVDGEAVPPPFGLFCVADGAGGQGGGEVASAVAVRAVAHDLIGGVFLNTLEYGSAIETPPMEDAVRTAFERANQVVREQADGGATTLTAVVLLAEQLVIGHVGDSRVYLLDGEKVEIVTRDHSFAWRLVEIGQITPEEVVEHPQRNMLWKAIGKDPTVVPEVITRPVPRGGHLLLCSDGLWNEVSQEEIYRLVTQIDEPQRGCETLVQAAYDAGGSDNITAVLVAFPSA